MMGPVEGAGDEDDDEEEEVEGRGLEGSGVKAGLMGRRQGERRRQGPSLARVGNSGRGETWKVREPRRTLPLREAVPPLDLLTMAEAETLSRRASSLSSDFWRKMGEKESSWAVTTASSESKRGIMD